MLRAVVPVQQSLSCSRRLHWAHSICRSFCAIALQSQPYVFVIEARYEHNIFTPFPERIQKRHFSTTFPSATRIERGIQINSKSANTHLQSPKSISTIIDVSESDIFTYKAQRWLWDELSQLQRRYLKFNTPSLIYAAEKTLGRGAKCVEMTKLPEGNFNKTLLLKMEDGREVIAKLPNPNAGRPYYTVASEVATMDYVRNRLQIPVPKVLAYNTRAQDNDVGAEYIIMEKCHGVELGYIWDELTAKEKVEIVRQLATYSARFAKAKFPSYGSLYYSRDIPDIKGTEVDDTFSVGPTTGRAWFDDRRGEVEVDRGPWKSSQAVLAALAQREKTCIETFPTSPSDRHQDIFNSPNNYHPSKSRKLSVLKDYALILPFLLPQDPSLTASTLQHTDLHTHNIFIHPSSPTLITAIIDWQCVHLSPSFLHTTHPSLLNHPGPKLTGLTLPQLPKDFEDMDEKAQKRARELHTAQSLWGLYRIFATKQDPEMGRALGYHDTLAGQIITAASSIFDGGEVRLQNLLARLVEPEMWGRVVGQNVVCPLSYSADELARQREDLEAWERDVECRARAVEELGVYEGWGSMRIW